MAKSIRVNEGDWICSDSSCGNVNFSWRDKCNKCGRDKGKVDTFKKTGAEIGKQAASKSGGLFSAEDWQCAMCGNVNWARRNECNMCKQPKFAKIEARTGVGGGYCERDNVEYIDREDSDDEIDEFGRKKKQFRLNKNGSTNDNENEESEEDDDDVDLSKYDLAASDEEEGSQEEIHKFSSFKNNSKSSTSDQKSTDTKRNRSRSPDHRRRSRSPDHRRRSRSPHDRYSRDRRRSGSGERRHRHDNERRERRRSRSPERRRRSYRSRS
ncbi:PREDICTED: zinc finger Ran-binding domain-containing protein 2-like [Amphimedon queenslandica]|uniref:Zinc finger Ran-binding domain-containing protein 2 n=2 Tax=Amphimedon queenslandica TaxID=400682 RepID=A0A1X7TYS8_AMPQE|nr:PREDICTED: zinc finger Ran-binding domain-containing protein 2-like [Amphimedon queenslandica]|eukprot:XP_019856906.1 PREDICTED: zinc finger Ran-binding domain-containing protein 2-like [Amphimedon queenslandica]